MEIERTLSAKVADKGQDWRTEVGARVIPVARLISRVPANRAADVMQTRQSRSRRAGGGISFGGCSGRSRQTESCLPPAA